MIHLVQFNSIIILENRQRKEFDPQTLMELVNSIDSPKGLLHPPVVRGVAWEPILVAGERRLRAIKELWALGGKLRFGGKEIEEGLVPVTFLGDLSPLEAKEAELEENIRRVDLTWQERSTAMSELVSLRQAQAEEKGLPSPTTADLAIEVFGYTDGSRREVIRQESILAKHLDDPEIASAKTSRDAFKVLKRKEESRKNSALAEQIGKSFSAAQHTLLHGDCLELMKTLPAESFDVILSDPPYGMGADEFGDSGGAAHGAHQYTDDLASSSKCYLALAQEGFRLAKPQAHAYLFCDLWRFTWLHLEMERQGWRVFHTPLIWHKPNGNRAPWPQMGPQRKYECILFAMKGNRSVMKLDGDVLTFPSDDNLGHRAQKPVGLFAELLRRSARPGDTVLDPFCGSGTIFPAASELLCTATGIELDQSFYGMAAKRLEKLK